MGAHESEELPVRMRNEAGSVTKPECRYEKGER
jgi:hypothetical protein